MSGDAERLQLKGFRLRSCQDYFFDISENELSHPAFFLLKHETKTHFSCLREQHNVL